MAKGREFLASGQVKDALAHFGHLSWDEKSAKNYRELRNEMIAAAKKYVQGSNMWPTRLLMEFVVEREPDCYVANFTLARAYVKQKKIDAAGQRYFSAFKLIAAKDATTWLSSHRDELGELSGKAKSSLGDLFASFAEERYGKSNAQARTLAKEALNFTGNTSAEGHLVFGRILLAEGDTAKGLDHIRKYTDSPKAFPNYSVGLDLEAYLQKLQEKGDLYSRIALKRARAAKRAFNKHQFDVSEKLYKQIAARFPKIKASVSHYFVSAGARVLKQKRYTLAKQLLEVSLSFNPKNEKTHKYLADYYIDKGNLTKAKAHYTKALGKL